MKRIAVICVLMIGATATAGVASAAEPSFDAEAAMAKLRALQGDWRGALSYLDYGTGERQSIGQAASLELTPDGAFLISNGRFTDPGFDVFILTVQAIDRETGDLVETFHRDGEIETSRFKTIEFSETDAGWRFVFETDGRDADRPAAIRRILTLENETLTRRKEVDFLDDDASAFIFRNETVMTRSADPVTFDDFRQKN
ncbi:MAG: hypothetical protein AAGJ87_06905 [Pseudomonadota bacterium]